LTTLALADSKTYWAVALSVGVVVLAVVVVLTALLLGLLRDIAASVTRLLEVGDEIAQNTSTIGQLAETGAVLEMIREEALVHEDYLEARLR